MEQSHLVALIKALKAEEMRQLLQFSSETYYNASKMKTKVTLLISP